MRLNRKVRLPLVWLWCADVWFYALAFPVVQCFVNRQLTVALYALPGLIICFFGGLLNLRITDRLTMAMLYDRWFTQITLLDAFVWIAYFALWIAGIVPDRWYPVAASVMHVSTVQFSRAVREELKNRMYPLSADRTEFDNACSIVTDMLNAVACALLLLTGMESFVIGRWILVFAMVVDNALFLYIRWAFEHGRLGLYENKASEVKEDGAA